VRRVQQAEGRQDARGGEDASSESAEEAELEDAFPGPPKGPARELGAVPGSRILGGRTRAVGELNSRGPGWKHPGLFIFVFLWYK